MLEWGEWESHRPDTTRTGGEHDYTNEALAPLR